MSEDKLEFSGHPNYLEWYKCYDELSSTEWDDGSELRKHKDKWDERTIQKWHFFYRPFPPVVGRPQKKMINERRAAIKASQAEIEHEKARISGENEKIRKALNILIIWSALWAVPFLWLLSTDYWQTVILPIGAAGVTLWKFEEKRRAARAEIQNAERRIEHQNGEIHKNEREIALLEGEIRHLLGQIPKPVNASTIAQWLKEELAQMECVCLGDFVCEEINSDNITKHLPQTLGDPRVRGLLIDSWGFLQPLYQNGPMGREAIGLGKAWDDLQSHIATWQVGGNGVPIFRLLFLQYVFPLERNLNICSFFYDFVTRRTYGKRFETFQYNHVTNFSLRELDLQAETWIHERGLDTVSSLLKGKSLQALTITVAGGSHFRCVLVDEGVADILNELLKQEEKYRVLRDSLLSEEELREKFHGDKKLIDEWKDSETARTARLEAKMKEVVQEKQRIQWNPSRTAQTIYTHVRKCVEEYIQRFQHSAWEPERTARG